MANRALAWLAAATAATTTAFTFRAVAVIVDYIQLSHGFHLLSNRSLSIYWGKKKRRLLVDDLENRFCCLFLGRKFDHQLSAAHDNIFLI